MSENATSGLSISEKSSRARREFWKKVEFLIKEMGQSNAFFQEIAEKAILEYLRIFGRIGVNPLLFRKGGKQRPRYLMDRDEIWVLYKPPLWQMGGSEVAWLKKITEIMTENRALNLSQAAMMKTTVSESMYVWHGLTQGLKYVDPEQPVIQLGFIQRLDLETDGPIVIAKTWRAQRYLQMQMKQHIFNKGYICLVHGKVDNGAKFFKARFSELGSDVNTQIMLKSDVESDPFFDVAESGRIKRSTRTAETFYKPIAYFRRKEDNSEYSLVYVNILSGITHQIRITMQAEGHPLVSDDRYLPKAQATNDLMWCPRNFLVEVRSDFFDFSGPHPDPKRRRLSRISIENPLPQFMQDVLEKKLELVEKCDPTADLYVGCQYWAIGDEQLMNAHPKDLEFRQKVMRWGQRKGISLDALDRLLLLPKSEVDSVLQAYVPPGDRRNVGWICDKCMTWNAPDWHGPVLECKGGAGFKKVEKDGGKGKGKGKKDKGERLECGGTKMMNEDTAANLPKGWLDYTADPTFHFLLQIHPMWLDARRSILKFQRPSWERPPVEPEGTLADEGMMESLQSALVLKAKEGVYGISEQDLNSIGGLRDAELPLQVPEDGPVRRCRLPGKGTLSQWTYALKGKELVKYSANIDMKTKKLPQGVAVKSDSVPPGRIISSQDIQEAQRKREKEEKVEEQRKRAKLAKEKKENEVAWWEDDQAGGLASPPLKRQKTQSAWEQKESSSKPGYFYWFNAETGASQTQKPDDVEEAPREKNLPGAWRKVQSKSNPGSFYYHNPETGETSMQEPPASDVPAKRKAPREEQQGDVWQRRESLSKPGNFYYFNEKTGDNEVHPPRVSPPWQLLESKTKRGQFYYFNEVTGAQSVDPPRGARPASASKMPQGDRPGGSSGPEDLPAGWERKESDKFKGKFYYVNTRTGETMWTAPAQAKWERKESSSAPGKFYYVNAASGETSWTQPKT